MFFVTLLKKSMSDKKIISKFFNFIEKLDCIDKLNIKNILIFFYIFNF